MQKGVQDENAEVQRWRPGRRSLGGGVVSPVRRDMIPEMTRVLSRFLPADRHEECLQALIDVAVRHGASNSVRVSLERLLEAATERRRREAESEEDA